MGCQISVPLGFSEYASECSVEPGLLEHYAIGEKLGSGAYGVVARCRSRATGEDLAVKIVDVQQHPSANVLAEAAIMKRLSHPNVVKFHGLFHQCPFVYIVMDAYSGGDLVDGLQAMMQSIHTERPEPASVVHVVRQMTASVEYLHSLCIVHRDVKGDNFLMDRPDLTDPACRIALADFGAACVLAPGQRLSKMVGTAKFAAPEMLNGAYREKVDLWALGVVTYGLLSGRFPFRNEQEIRNKQVRLPPEVGEPCASFVLGLLQKREAFRLSAEEAAGHPWLRTEGTDTEAEVEAKVSESESTTAFETGSEEESRPLSSGPWRAATEASRSGAEQCGGGAAGGDAAAPCSPPLRARRGSGEALRHCFEGLSRCRPLGSPGRRPESDAPAPLLRTEALADIPCRQEARE